MGCSRRSRRAPAGDQEAEAGRAPVAITPATHPRKLPSSTGLWGLPGRGPAPSEGFLWRRKDGWTRGWRLLPEPRPDRQGRRAHFFPGWPALPQCGLAAWSSRAPGGLCLDPGGARAHKGSHPAGRDPSPADAPAAGKGHTEGAGGEGLSSSSGHDGSGEQAS